MAPRSEPFPDWHDHQNTEKTGESLGLILGKNIIHHALMLPQAHCWRKNALDFTVHSYVALFLQKINLSITANFLEYDAH